MRKGGSQLGRVTGEVDIRKTFEVFRDFGLPFRIEERAPAARHQKLGQRQFRAGVLRAVDRRLCRHVGKHQRFGLSEQIT